MLKYLRIAVTVIALTACVFVVALWVRSYSRLDRVDGPVGQFYPGWTAAAVSVQGVLMFGAQPEQYNVYAAQSHAFRFNSGPIERGGRNQIDRGFLGFKILREKKEWGVQLPHWAAVVALAAFAAVPWGKRIPRFSLRALMVAMTLVAVMFGIVAFSMK